MIVLIFLCFIFAYLEIYITLNRIKIIKLNEYALINSKEVQEHYS